jgi:hypothetical protein
MDVSQITFGIEIETTMPATYRIGGYRNGVQAEGLPAGWQAKHDGSIRPSRGRIGCEFVSPVLRGVEGLRQVKAAVEAITAMGGRVNRSCGFHVHVGLAREDQAGRDRLLTLVSNFETALYASTGTKRRQQTHWCRSVRQYGNRQQAAQVSSRDRYHGLNLTNWAGGTIPAVEFRFFAGTLNFGKIVAHIRQCVGLVERALKAKRVTQWVAKVPSESSPIHRSGEGQTELTRLFYQLGWIKGRQEHVHGDLSAPGLPTMQQSKRALMKLARKYDAQP